MAKHWTILEVSPPMEGASHHWKLVPHRHVAFLSDLSPEAKDELWELLGKVKKDFPGYSWAHRAGDPGSTGGPVSIVDIIVGDPSSTKTARYQMG